MKKLISLLIVLFCFGNGTLLAQPKVQVSVFILDNRKSYEAGDTIYYNGDRSLTWADFRGTPDLNSDAAAVTASGFAYNASVRSNSKIFRLNIFIYTFFNKRNSWKKNNIKSDYHLRHEQVHFDITRIAAENFKTMLNDVTFTPGNYLELLRHVWSKAQDSWNMMQDAYDEETNHSIRKQDQRRWNVFAEEEIRKLYPKYSAIGGMSKKESNTY